MDTTLIRSLLDKRDEIDAQIRDATSGSKPRAPRRVAVPYNPVAEWPKMIADEFQAIRRSMKAKYGYEPVHEKEPVLAHDPDDIPSTPQPKRNNS